MKIKNATIKDFDTAYEYIKKLWDYNTYDYETTKEVYEKVLQDENSFAFFAIEEDGTFHGFCHGDYFQTFWMSGLTCYVSSLITNEEDRGKGYGVKLLDHAKKLAKERGCKAITLDSGLPRVQAHGFYGRAFGFGGYLRYIRAYRGGKIHVAGCHVPRPFLPYAANGAGEGE